MGYFNSLRVRAAVFSTVIGGASPSLPSSIRPVRFNSFHFPCGRGEGKAHRPVLYANYLTSGTLHQHLAEIDQACNERMEIIVSAMAKQECVTEALKAAEQMEWVRRMNNIRSRAEEIVLTELVYE